MAGLLNQRWGRGCSRRQRACAYLNSSLYDAHLIGGDLLGKRRRGTAVVRTVLPAVPGAGDATVDDLPFTERAALVRTGVRDGADGSLVLEDGDPFASACT